MATTTMKASSQQLPAPALASTAPQDTAALSLLSLSLAAAARSPEPTRTTRTSPRTGLTSAGTHSGLSNTSMNGSSTTAITTGNVYGSAPKMHRLSSTGASRRRLSDAHNAATRPSLHSLGSGSSPPSSAYNALGHTHTHAGQPCSIGNGDTAPVPVPGARTGSVASSAPGDDLLNVPFGKSSSVTTNGSGSGTGIGISTSTSTSISTSASIGNTSGKKRGQIYTCEQCAKQYKHPSCLIKHRWEHSPHWREASKFVLSKHQQVQLLEAAAILSHISTSPTGSSLPEDRSLWPSFLSPGMGLPSTVKPGTSGASPLSGQGFTPSPSNGSVSGPRMHDYSLSPTALSKAAELRPGLLGVPTPPHGGTPQPHSQPHSQSQSRSQSQAPALVQVQTHTHATSPTPFTSARPVFGQRPSPANPASSFTYGQYGTGVTTGTGTAWTYGYSTSGFAYDARERERDRDRERERERDRGSLTDSSFGRSPFSSASVASERWVEGSSPASSFTLSHSHSHSHSKLQEGEGDGEGDSDMDEDMNEDMDDGDSSLLGVPDSRPTLSGHRVGSWSLPASDIRSSSVAMSEDEATSSVNADAGKHAFSRGRLGTIKHEDEEDEEVDEYGLPPARTHEDEWAGDMDMD